MPTPKIREYHDDQMSGKPDIVITQVLVDEDQDQDARHKNTEHNVGPLRYGASGKMARVQKQIHKHHDTRKNSEKSKK